MRHLDLFQKANSSYQQILFTYTDTKGRSTQLTQTFRFFEVGCPLEAYHLIALKDNCQPNGMIDQDRRAYSKS